MREINDKTRIVFVKCQPSDDLKILINSELEKLMQRCPSDSLLLFTVINDDEYWSAKITIISQNLNICLQQKGDLLPEVIQEILVSVWTQIKNWSSTRDFHRGRYLASRGR